MGALLEGTGPQRSCLGAGYIYVTQTFGILAALCGLVSLGLLVLSCVPSLSAPGRGPLVASIVAFAAGKVFGLPVGPGSRERLRRG